MIISYVISIVIDEHDGGDSISELHSHANMVVVDKYATILADTGNKMHVSPFTPDYHAMEKV